MIAQGAEDNAMAMHENHPIRSRTIMVSFVVDLKRRSPSIVGSAWKILMRTPDLFKGLSIHSCFSRTNQTLPVPIGHLAGHSPSKKHLPAPQTVQRNSLHDQPDVCGLLLLAVTRL